MKKRILSTIITLASISAMAQAFQRDDVRVLTMVRDGSGRPVQGASLKFYGPFGRDNRRSEMSTYTGRNGESDKSMMPGRYLVIASDVERGIESKTIDVDSRRATNTFDLKLHTTRRPTIQFVVMSDDRNEPVANAKIEITSRETGKRDSLNSRGSGLTQYDIPNNADAGRFDVRISSTDFDTQNLNINFRPGTDTSSFIAYVQLRRNTNPRGGPDRNPPNRNQPKLDGMIRLSSKNRIEVGDVASINVGLMFSKTINERSQAISTVTITNPNGQVILNDSRNVRLILNDYVNTSYDVSTRMSGMYTVNVSAVMANGSGIQNSRWDSKFTFNVHGQTDDRGRTDIMTDRGDYTGMSDMEMDNKSIRSFIMSLTLSKGTRNLDTVKGWLSPRSGSGFHMMFQGTYDQNKGRLDARGTMADREDKRWEIRATGSPDRNNRLAVRLEIRALDNSYNRSFNFTLAKK